MQSAHRLAAYCMARLARCAPPGRGPVAPRGPSFCAQRRRPCRPAHFFFTARNACAARRARPRPNYRPAPKTHNCCACFPPAFVRTRAIVLYPLDRPVWQEPALGAVPAGAVRRRRRVRCWPACSLLPTGPAGRCCRARAQLYLAACTLSLPAPPSPAGLSSIFNSLITPTLFPDHHKHVSRSLCCLRCLGGRPRPRPASPKAMRAASPLPAPPLLGHTRQRQDALGPGGPGLGVPCREAACPMLLASWLIVPWLLTPPPSSHPLKPHPHPSCRCRRP